MSLRILARRFRFYYKPNSRELYRQAFQNHKQARWFPFFGDGTFIPRNGMPAIHVPRNRWSSLATAARLVLMDAYPKWDDETLAIEWNGFTFVQPAAERWTPQIMIEDPWRTKGQNLKDKIVLDVGAFIGDSSIAYALAGAKVHAFEAVPIFAQYVMKNVKLNRMEDHISVHSVGLSNQCGQVKDLDKVRSIASMSHNCLPDDDVSQEVQLVDAIDYLQNQGITRADIVKMNCEGCEYQLIGDARLLRYLNPERVLVDYHYGSQPLRKVLAECNYEVKDTNPGEERGTLFATRR
ncbi:MAG: FkbM family methyltransferase [Gammaproteobacteria bacterium]|nr:FkbM family methyltransferase [Gammaproteobacteria bacterium]